MADVDNEEVIKAIKDNIGNSADVNIFLEETSFSITTYIKRDLRSLFH